MMRISMFAHESWLAYTNADLDASPFPFFKLPPEIRNIIYKLSSRNVYSQQRSHVPVWEDDESDNEVIWPSRRQQMVYNNSGMIKQPALFRCCSLARSEGLPLYYRECTHIFERHSTGESDARILDWLRAITGQGFYVKRLHILIDYPCDCGDSIDSSLRIFTRGIYSILFQDITLYYSDYDQSSFVNGVLMGLATYIHSLKDWLFGNEGNVPFFRFEGSFSEGRETKSLRHVQRFHREYNSIFLDTPATLIAYSQTAYNLLESKKKSLT